MLIRLFQQTTIGCGTLRAGFSRGPLRHESAYRAWVTSGSEAEQGLERGHGLPAPIVAKYEFVEIDLELIAAHPVVGSDQPLLQVANRAVRQRHHGLRAFA